MAPGTMAPAPRHQRRGTWPRGTRTVAPRHDGTMAPAVWRPSSGFVHTPSRCPRSAPRDPFQRSPAAAHDAVADDDGFGVAAARRCESTLHAGARGERREVALIEVNAADCQRLRVQRDDA